MKTVYRSVFRYVNVCNITVEEMKYRDDTWRKRMRNVRTQLSVGSAVCTEAKALSCSLQRIEVRRLHSKVTTQTYVHAEREEKRDGRFVRMVSVSILHSHSEDETCTVTENNVGQMFSFDQRLFTRTLVVVVVIVLNRGVAID